jgi:alkanesulfonate monooxygenase SsuD/methylene tetrahydromethanopterin reductase-like flavin-dependent oxidoreductase (luciferase family)
VRFGLDAANFGDYSDPFTLAELAAEAEDAGWDGFFVFDHILPNDNGSDLFDPWVILAAIAMRTDRIRIGPMVTPIPRRRPWKLARESVSLDYLSGGRLTLSVGLGGPPEREFQRFGETVDARIRAEMLDEGLEVLKGLWCGEPFDYEGKHYQLNDVVFTPKPVQYPRIPIWIGCKWKNKKPLRRAAQWEGIFPIPHNGETITPNNLRTVVGYVDAHRDRDSKFDVALADHDGSRTQESLAAYEQAGLTWWIQRIHSPWVNSLDEARACIREGPPIM